MHLAKLAVCKATVQLVTKYETRETPLMANTLHHEAIKYQKEKHCTSQTYTRDKCEIQVLLKGSDDGHFLILHSKVYTN